MCYEETVWLSTDDIRRKYEKLFEERKFSESFIGTLFDAHLLRGYYNRSKRQVFILEKSWLNLLVHMNYTLYLQLQPVGEPIKFSIPEYCKNIGIEKTYHLEKNWLTPTEILETYKTLREDHTFTEKFITQLVETGILRGKYDSTLKVTHVLLASFIELMYYRDDTIKKNLFSPDSNP